MNLVRIVIGGEVERQGEEGEGEGEEEEQAEGE